MSVTVISINGTDYNTAEEIACKLVSTGKVAASASVVLHQVCQASLARSWFIKAELTNEAYYATKGTQIDAYFEVCGVQFYAGNIGPSYFTWLIKTKTKSDTDERIQRTLDYFVDEMQMMYKQEATFLKKVEEFCQMLGPSCILIREATATRNGISDLLLCYKGRFIACELKGYSGEPSVQQLKFIEKVKAAGGSGGVCKCLTDVWELMDHTVP